MIIITHTFNFSGYPITRDILREEFRQRRSVVRVCGCKRSLNHMESNWVACRTPEGKHVDDFMVCDWCLTGGAVEIVKDYFKNPLTAPEYDTILILVVRGSELFM